MINHVIVYGIVLSVIGSGIILISLYFNPRLWLQDYPKEIQQAVAPKTKEEKRQSLYWGIPFLVVLFAVPFLCAWTARNQDPGTSSFGSLFLHAFGVGIFFNIVDLILIDYAVVCLWRPEFIIIPGTRGMKAYRDYVHHLKAFMIGVVVSALASLLIAGIIKST